MARSFWLFRLKEDNISDPCELFSKLRRLKPYRGIDYEQLYKMVMQLSKGNVSNLKSKKEITGFEEGFDEPRRVFDVAEYMCTINFIRSSITLRMPRGSERPAPIPKNIFIQLWALNYNDDFYIIISTGEERYIENMIFKYLEKAGIDIENSLEKISFPVDFIWYVNEYPGNPPILSEHDIENIGLYGKEGKDWVKASFESSDRKEIPRKIKPKDSMRLMIPVPYNDPKSKHMRDYIKAWFYPSGKITVSARGDIALQKYEIENILHAALLVKKIAYIWKDDKERK